MRIFKTAAFFAVLFLAGFVFSYSVFAVEITNPLKFNTVEALIEAITDFIFWVGITVAPVMLIIAGFLYVASAGSPQRIETAKHMMLYAIVGLAVILFAKGIIAVLKSIIGVQ